MKSLLVTIVGGLLLAGCGKSQPGSTSSESSRDETSTMRLACIYGHYDAVKQHLAAGIGANAYFRDDVPNGHPAYGNTSETPLFCAAFGGSKEVVELLIAKGADVNARDRISCRTPLHDAVDGLSVYSGLTKKQRQADLVRHMETIDLLIAKGAKVNALSGCSDSSYGATPLDSAVSKAEQFIENAPRFNKLAELLRRYGGKRNRN